MAASTDQTDTLGSADQYESRFCYYVAYFSLKRFSELHFSV